MQPKAIQFAIAALFASLASGQAQPEKTVDRLVHFTHADTEPAYQEIATDARDHRHSAGIR